MNTRSMASLFCMIVVAGCTHVATDSTKVRDPIASGKPSTAGDAEREKPGTDHDAKPESKTELPSRIKTAAVVATRIERTVSAYGSVVGGDNEEASLAFAIPGQIAHVSASIGDHVSVGETLAQLDPEPFLADVSAAESNVAAARANLEKIRLAARPQQIDATNAQLVQARSQFAIAQAQLERQRRLVALGVAPKTDLEFATTQAASAREQLAVLGQQLASQQQPWKPDVDVGRAMVAQAQAALSAARGRLGRAYLKAPFSGTVIARLHNDGETVDTTNSVIQIAGDRPAIFTANFSPADAIKIGDGAMATVTLQGSMASMRGRVVARNLAQSSSRTVSVLIRLTTARRDFGPGAYGSARIAIGDRFGLVVPDVSVVSDAATGVTQIFRKDGERFTPVPVDVIDREGGRALIVGFGLRKGDLVATEGAAELLSPVQAPKKDSD
jgi:multidrug resistance efflux pump